MDASQFSALLQNMTVPDNEVRKKAEADYDVMFKQQGQWVLNALSNIVANEAPLQIHALSLTLLRRMFSRKADYFILEPPAGQETIKACVIQAFTNLTSGSQMKSVSACLAALAAKVYEAGGAWNDLWSNLFQTIQDDNANAKLRAGSCEVLASCATVMRPYLINHYGDLATGLVSCMRSTDAEVKKSAAYAMVELLAAVNPKQLQPFRQLPQHILDSVEASLNVGDYDAAIVLLSNICELIEQAPTVLKTTAEPMMQACMQLASTAGLDSGVRHVAVEVLVVMCTHNTKITKRVPGFCNSFVDLLFGYMLHPPIADDWDTTDDVESAELEGVTDFDVGVTSMDRVANALGPKVIAEHVQQIIAQNMKHAEWNHRQAALALLTYSAEGLREALVMHLEFIVDTVCSLAQDENQVVRYTVYQCLSQMSTDFAPDFQKKFHGKIMPTLITATADPVPKSLSVAIAAINSFFDDAEGGEEDEMACANMLAPYIGTVSEKLAHVFSTSEYLFIRAGCLTALGSIIAVGKSHLAPLVPHLVPLFQGVLSLPEDPANLIKARAYKCKAIECTTLLAGAVGFQVFAEYAHPVCQFLTQMMTENLTTDDPRLAYVLRGWTNMVDCLGGEIRPYLPTMMPPLMDLAKLACDMEIMDRDVGDDLEQEKEEKGVETMLMVLPGKGEVLVKTKTSLIEDKKTAAQIIVEILRSLSGKLVEFLPAITEVGMDLIDFCATSDLRVIGCETFDLLLIAYKDALPGEAPLFAMKTLEVMIKSVKEERQFDIMGSFLDTMGNMIPVCAPVLPGETLNIIAKLLLNVMQESTKRKREAIKGAADATSDLDEDEQDMLDEEIEAEAYLMDEIRVLAEKLLQHCPAYTAAFESEIMPMVQGMLGGEDAADIETGLGFIGVYLEFGANFAAAAHLGEIVPPILHFTNHAVADIMHTAFNCIRLTLNLCAAAYGQPHDGSLEFVKSALEKITSFFANPASRTPEFLGTTNNAAGAAMSIIEHYGAFMGDAVAPLLRQIVSYLPLSDDDEEEAKTVHEKLLQMVTGNHPLVGDLRASIVGKIQNAPPDCLNEATIAMLKAA